MTVKRFVQSGSGRHAELAPRYQRPDKAHKGVPHGSNRLDNASSTLQQTRRCMCRKPKTQYSRMRSALENVPGRSRV